MNWKRLIPVRLRMLISRKYADMILDEAIEKAEQMHFMTGKRYYVFPTKGGDLKVTDADTETRDRKRDKRLLKKSVRKPYQLRREAYYFTASEVCKKKYQPQGMEKWEAEAMRKLFYKFWFQHH